MSLPLDGEDELDYLRREVRELRSVCNDHPELYERYYHTECMKALKRSTVFSEVDDAALSRFADGCRRVVLPPGTELARQGKEWRGVVYFIVRGELARWSEDGGVYQKVKSIDDSSCGTIHLFIDDTWRFNIATDTEVVAYEMTKDFFDSVVRSEPALLQPIVAALAHYIRTQHRQVTSGAARAKGLVTPRETTAYTTTALAVFIESFYRSAMNNVINAKLDGKPIGGPSTWFPKMHIQIPTRILYITGLKEIRRACGEIETRDRAVSQKTLKLVLSFVPGVVMCPLSSVLEATHSRQNTEPMMQRWRRGYAPRLVREVLFGIGINQLSDYCRELVPSTVTNQHARTALGSIAAGMLSGYLSQVPHNLSTMKLMDPSQPYRALWAKLWTASMARVPDSVPEPFRPAAARVMAVAAPIGCLRRCVQIGGSFIIINGLLYKWRDKNWW